MNDRIGQRLGSYRLTRLLGRGGFADVYLGEHTYLKTPAVIQFAAKPKPSSVPRFSLSKSSLMLDQRADTKQPASKELVLINLIILGGIIGGIVLLIIFRMR